MNNEQNDKQPLNLDELEKVAGGGMLEDLLNIIRRDGRWDELKTIFKTQGKSAASAKCCEYYRNTGLCAFCSTAVAML